RRRRRRRRACRVRGAPCGSRTARGSRNPHLPQPDRLQPGRPDHREGHGPAFERAVQTLVLEPLGLSESLYAMDDIMTRPAVAMGHNADESGDYAIARQWKDNRANNPGGGIASSVADLLRWARFHLTDGHAPDGTEILPPDTLHQMRVPTAELHASTLG